MSSFLFDCRCVHAPVPCRTKSLMSLDYPERKYEKPEWHAPWKLHRVRFNNSDTAKLMILVAASQVIAGHLGWVHGLAVEPGNEWFASASADRTIKIWDLATGTLKLTLTGTQKPCLRLGALLALSSRARVVRRSHQLGHLPASQRAQPVPVLGGFGQDGQM